MTPFSHSWKEYHAEDWKHRGEAGRTEYRCSGCGRRYVHWEGGDHGEERGTILEDCSGGL